MKEAIDKNIALGVIILSTGLMQIHSIQFWYARTGWTGPFFSLALEGAMLWLWYEKRLGLVRVLAAFILIAGPWYVLTEPIIDDIARQLEVSSSVEMAAAKVERLRDSKKTYDENSKKIRGWAKRIDRTEAKLEEAEKELEKRQTTAARLGFVWRNYMAAGMEALVLFIVLTTALTAIKTLRPVPEKVSGGELKNLKKELKKSKHIPEKRPEISEKDRAVSAVAKILKSKLREYDGVASAMADDLGFSKKNVSLISRHFENKRTRKETISNNALQDMMVKLGVKKGEY